MEESNKIAKRLRVLRKDRKMGQKELGKLIGVATNTVSNYE